MKGVGVKGPNASPERGPAFGLSARVSPLSAGLGPRECGSQFPSDQQHVVCSQAQRAQLGFVEKSSICFSVSDWQEGEQPHKQVATL